MVEVSTSCLGLEFRSIETELPLESAISTIVIALLIVLPLIAFYQLIPRFWEGDFKTGYVNSDFENELQNFISPMSPYFRDLIFLSVGYFVFRSGKTSNSFVNGLVIVLFVLSPLYDVFNNYFAFVLSARNDFTAIKGTIGSLWTHTIGLLFTLAGMFVLWTVFMTFKETRSEAELKAAT